MPIPVLKQRATNFGLTAIKELTAKKLIVIVLGAAGWYASLTGSIKDVHAEVKDVHGEVLVNKQTAVDQQIQLNSLRDSTKAKVDKETYDRDIRDLREGQKQLQATENETLQLLIALKAEKR